jgi:hypothetical protein
MLPKKAFHRGSDGVRAPQLKSALGFFTEGFMKHIPIAVVLLLLVTIANIVSRANAQLAASESATLCGRVFRSDTNVAIGNAYILLMQEKEKRAEAKHFDTRTDNGWKISLYEYSRREIYRINLFVVSRPARCAVRRFSRCEDRR